MTERSVAWTLTPDPAPRRSVVPLHPRLRYPLIIDLKLGVLTHADMGQMHLYCNYTKELLDENPPLGLILCADKGYALARYAWRACPASHGGASLAA